MEKEEFVDKLFIALQRLSSGAQKRVLEDMRRLNSSILCKEHRVYDVNKEKPIARVKDIWGIDYSLPNSF